MSQAVRQWLEAFNGMTSEERREATRAFRSRRRPGRKLLDVNDIDQTRSRHKPRFTKITTKIILILFSAGWTYLIWAAGCVDSQVVEAIARREVSLSEDILYSEISKEMGYDELRYRNIMLNGKLRSAADFAIEGRTLRFIGFVWLACVIGLWSYKFTTSGCLSAKS